MLKLAFRGSRASAMVTVGVLVVGAACSGDDDADGTQSGVGTGGVSVVGGARLTAGDATASVPENAVPEGTTLSFSALTTAPATARVPAGTAVALKPFGMTLKEPVQLDMPLSRRANRVDFWTDDSAEEVEVIGPRFTASRVTFSTIQTGIFLPVYDGSLDGAGGSGSGSGSGRAPTMGGAGGTDDGGADPGGAPSKGGAGGSEMMGGAAGSGGGGTGGPLTNGGSGGTEDGGSNQGGADDGGSNQGMCAADWPATADWSGSCASCLPTYCCDEMAACNGDGAVESMCRWAIGCLNRGTTSYGACVSDISPNQEIMDKVTAIFDCAGAHTSSDCPCELTQPVTQ